MRAQVLIVESCDMFSFIDILENIAFCNTKELIE
jgi:hypothetical protein